MQSPAHSPSEKNILEPSPPCVPACALGTALALTAALSGCGVREKVRDITQGEPPFFPPLPKTANTELARTVLSRLTFGGTAAELQRVCEMGAGGFVEEQLASHREEPFLLKQRVGSLDVQSETESSPDTLENLSDEQLLREIQQAAILRGVYSKNQLGETLADFWTNHFNIYALKNNERVLLPIDAETVVRPHRFGKFRDLLTASAHSPAMLSYLDNQLNQRGVANENYARELLELHTLGVHSGYTLKDIQEVARCFTGWRVRRGFEGGAFHFTKAAFTQKPSDYHFDPQMHDSGAKYIPFLNLSIAPNGGVRDADTVLEALAVHPATARFLAEKLCRRFLGEAPERIVLRSAAAYLKADTEIEALLRPILLDGLVRADAGTRTPILKRPLEFLVSSLRVFAADTDGGGNLQPFLQSMGQPLYQWPMPDGYPEKEAAWTGSLLGRWNYALALTANKIGGTQVDFAPLFGARNAVTLEQKTRSLMEAILLTPAEDPRSGVLKETLLRHGQTASRSKAAEERTLAEIAALILASPEFQRR